MKVPFMLNEYTYVYNYTLTFKMKDNKYKIILDNVYCESAYAHGSALDITKIDPFDGDNCPETGTMRNPGLPRKKAIAMMASFKSELQAIIDRYSEFIQMPSASGDW